MTESVHPVSGGARWPDQQVARTAIQAVALWSVCLGGGP